MADRQQLRLAEGDPMLSRLDLAYSLNMHMAQGITTDKAITVMSSHERTLSNQRLFNVGVTRVRDALTLVVDNREKLERDTKSSVEAKSVTVRVEHGVRRIIHKKRKKQTQYK